MHPASEREQAGIKSSSTETSSKLQSNYYYLFLLICYFLLRQTGINTNATKSVPSPVMNLCEEDPNVNINSVIEAVGWEYMRTDPFNVKEGGKHLISEQRGFQLVNPTDQWFPGIVYIEVTLFLCLIIHIFIGLSEIRSNLISWDWCYGKTPNFFISRTFPVPSQLLVEPMTFNGTNSELKITVHVNQGRVADVVLNIPQGLSSTGLHGDVKVITSLKGCKFTEEAMSRLESSLAVDNILAADKDKFVTECVRQVMTSV